jgi:hypothetical protein
MERLNYLKTLLFEQPPLPELTTGESATKTLPIGADRGRTLRKKLRLNDRPRGGSS